MDKLEWGVPNSSTLRHREVNLILFLLYRVSYLDSIPQSIILLNSPAQQTDTTDVIKIVHAQSTLTNSALSWIKKGSLL